MPDPNNTPTPAPTPPSVTPKPAPKPPEVPKVETPKPPELPKPVALKPPEGGVMHYVDLELQKAIEKLKKSAERAKKDGISLAQAICKTEQEEKLAADVAAEKAQKSAGDYYARLKKF